MTGSGPTGSGLPAAQAGGDVPSPPSSAEARAARLSLGNMLRSLLPLAVLVLLLGGWLSFLHRGADPVHPIDPSSTVQLAAARASYPLSVPTGLPAGYRPTSARTDAGRARPGGPVTLEIGYVTPAGQFAGFTISDDAGAQPLSTILDGAQDRGSVDLAGAGWARSTTRRGELAFSRRAGTATIVVSGSASEQELATVAAAVRPYSG